MEGVSANRSVPRIVVAGAGVAGLSAASALRRCGLMNVTIVDKRSPAQLEQGFSNEVSLETFAALRSLGVSTLHLPDHADYYAKRVEWEQLPVTPPAEPPRIPINRGELVHLLLENLVPDVRYIQARYMGVAESGRPSVLLDNGDAPDCDILIDATGKPRLVKGDLTRRYCGYVCFIEKVGLGTAPTTALHQRLRDGLNIRGPGLRFNSAPRRHRDSAEWVCTVQLPESAARSLFTGGGLDRFEHFAGSGREENLLLRCLRGVDDELPAQIVKASAGFYAIAPTFSTTMQPVHQRLRGVDVLKIGDAMGVVPPLASSGTDLSIREAIECAQMIALHPDLALQFATHGVEMQSRRMAAVEHGRSMARQGGFTETGWGATPPFSTTPASL